VLPASALSIGLMSRDEPKQAEFMLTGLGKWVVWGMKITSKVYSPDSCIAKKEKLFPCVSYSY
jgi:hypothetical protein